MTIEKNIPFETYFTLTSERASVIKTVSNCLSGRCLEPPNVSADSCNVTLGFGCGIVVSVAGGVVDIATVRHKCVYVYV